MPEDAIDKKLTELTSPTVYTDIGNSDYLFVAHYNSTTQEYENLKVSVTELASKLLKNIEFTSDLETTSKIIINAINEIAQGGGGGGASSLSELTDVTITSPSTGQVLTYDAVTGKWVNGAGAEIALTSELISTLVTLSDGADDFPLKKWKTTIIPIQSSGTPSPTNPLPISGRTQIVATHTGKNLLGGSKLLANAQAHLTGGTTDLQNKTFTFSASETPVDNTSFSLGITFKERTRYTVIITASKSSGTATNIRVRYTDGSTVNISLGVTTKTTVAYVSTSNKTILDIRKYSGSGTTTLYYDECGVFEGVLTVNDFVAYAGESKTISLGGTIYGGELDILSGEGKNSYGIITLDGSEDWQAYNGGNGYSTEIATMKTGTYMQGWSNMFTASSDSTELHVVLGASNANKRVYFAQVNTIEGVTNVASWKTWLSNNNVQLVYPLATETDITATGEDFSTSDGNNGFYTDCGESDIIYVTKSTEQVVEIVNDVIANKEKVLTGTLTAGNTTITFTDNSLTSDCTKTLYVDDAFFGVAPTAITTDYANHSVTYTFPVQASNMPVKLEVK